MQTYFFGYLYGASVITSALLHTPTLSRPLGQILVVSAFIVVGVLCGVQIIRRKRLGWLVFFCVMLALIILQTMTAFQLSSVQLMYFMMGYTVWVLIGFIYYLNHKKLLS